jgi:hypothetical protein
MHVRVAMSGDHGSLRAVWLLPFAAAAQQGWNRAVTLRVLTWPLLPERTVIMPYILRITVARRRSLQGGGPRRGGLLLALVF